MVASFFWRKIQTLFFHFHSLHSGQNLWLLSLVEWNIPNWLNSGWKCLRIFWPGASKRSVGLEKLWKPRGAGFQLPAGVVLCAFVQTANFPSWPWFTLSGFTLCSCPSGPAQPFPWSLPQAPPGHSDLSLLTQQSDWVQPDPGFSYMLLLLSCKPAFLKKMESLMKAKTMFSQQWAE